MQDGIRPHRNCQSFIIIQSIIIQSIKMKGFNMQKPRCTSSSLSHNLSHAITKIVYNATIQYTTILQWFHFTQKSPWENTMGHPIPWVCKLLAKKYPKNFFQGLHPQTPQLGRVYSKTSVQTQLNNSISKYGRSSSQPIRKLMQEFRNP